jgi:putative drug exporter of the RND superfamily
VLVRLARRCYRSRRLVLLVWAAIAAGFTVLNSAYGGSFRDEYELPGTESQEAFDLLAEHGMDVLAGFTGRVVFHADDVTDPDVQQGVEALVAELDATIPESEVSSPHAEDAVYQISEDSTVAFAELNLSDRGDAQYDQAAAEARAIVEDFAGTPRLPDTQVELGGELFIEDAEFSTEGIGVVAAAVILLIAFGSVLAMGLPLITALFGIGTGVAVVGLAAQVMTMPTFATQTVLMIGIGVGIDYSLFIVTRFRESLGRGSEPEQAVTEAINTAGRAVVVAGTTVIIAVMGLLVAGVPMIHGLAVGIVLGVLLTLLATVTLLPAVLGFVGHNIDKLGLPHRRGMRAAGQRTVWHRWSRLIQGHPLPALLIALGVIAVLALPLLGIRLGFSDAGNRPTDDTTRRAYDLLAEGFGPGFNGPLLLAAETPGGADDLEVLGPLWAELNQAPGVAIAAPPEPTDDASAATLVVIPESAPQDEATTDLVHTLRDDVITPVLEGTDVEVKVGGLTAAAVDFADHLTVRMVWLIAIVLALSFVVLMGMFRSPVVALKAVLVNLLSVGAAYGVIVAVFQWGWGPRLGGMGQEGPIDAWVPMAMFAIVFGLSMDYEVFLLAGIREFYDRSGDSSQAVADGLAATARVITAAAAIMVCVFGAFVLSDIRALQMAGLGLATAIAVDASITRMIVVPSVMSVLGRTAWWLPTWLHRILPHVHVQAEGDRPPQHTNPGDDPET